MLPKNRSLGKKELRFPLGFSCSITQWTEWNHLHANTISTHYSLPSRLLEPVLNDYFLVCLLTLRNDYFLVCRNRLFSVDAHFPVRFPS